MSYNIKIPTALNEGFKTFGFDQEVGGCLYFCDNFDSVGDIELKLHLETAAISFQATAVFFRMELGKYKPQVYLYDYTGRKLEENLLTDIHKKVWSSGNVPIVCIFYDTEVKILDSSQPIQKNNKPVYLETIRLAQKAHHLYNEHFAFKLKTGVFWEEEDNKNKFKFQENSAYDVLILWVREIIKQISASNEELNQEEDIKVIKKVIIQSIMIKYFEERKDEFGKSPFNQKYFQKYNASNEFIDVLSNEKLIDLLEDLENDLNGNLFKWSKEEKNIIKKVNLNPLVQALKAYKRPEEVNNNIFEFIRYYEFNFIPVELISRLYEEFLAGDNDEFFNQKAKKQSEGIYYTPSHLAHLLIDECMPLQDYQKINFETYKVLDPACGSGIFLVLAFKRLVQWWRLQNDLQRPKVKDLKQLVKCVYGVDKEVQATQLAAFSLCLAMCDELTPKQIIDELQFDDLTKINILYSDFFINELASKKEDVEDFEIKKKHFEIVKKNEFDLVIGNPPFNRGALKGYDEYWSIEDEKIKFPQAQIALKFLVEAFKYLKKDGLQCLIIKASSILYNSTSLNYKKALFSNYNVKQVLDFTALARNKSLWDNGADVAAAAIFIKNESPNYQNNILHLVFRRTRAMKERLVFEIDDYDLHFINRNEAINNPYIWKINLLGGGRIKSLFIKSQQLNKFQAYIENHSFKPLRDGFIINENGDKEADFVHKYQVLDNGISHKGINYEKLKSNYFEDYGDNVIFKNIPNEEYFKAPNVLIWKNIGKGKLPVFFNEQSFLFNSKVICIKSDNIKLLKSLANNFKENSDFYRFLIFITSAETLLGRNTALFQRDYLNLRYVEEQSDFSLSSIDKKVIADVNNYYQLFIRHGERAKAAQRLKAREKKTVLLNFGQEFSKIMNLLYEEGDKQFKLTNVTSFFQNSYIGVVFKYNNESNDVKWEKDETIDINDLSEHKISRSLKSKRILRIYRFKDTVILIKPNQYRYWLSSTAYRDADKAIAHYSKIGY